MAQPQFAADALLRLQTSDSDDWCIVSDDEHHQSLSFIQVHTAVPGPLLHLPASNSDDWLIVIDYSQYHSS
jgi:hypothetical protein